jgi:hypothetical protein
MPQSIICNKCSTILYQGEILKAPQDIIKKFEGICPNCEKELNFDVEEIVIRPSKE